MQVYTLEINTGGGVAVEGVFATPELARARGIARALEEIADSQGQPGWFEQLIETREAHHAMYGKQPSWARACVAMLRNDTWDADERYEAAVEIIGWLDRDGSMAIGGFSMVDKPMGERKLYRFRVRDDNGNELGRWESYLHTDEDAVWEAERTKEGLVIYVDEIKCTYGEVPVEGEGFEPGLWEAHEALREVKVV